ncbi:hypothetical protein NDU88_010222 [Pleurodeles waltl]|uniref:Uncharacterized protein n=1 Tax=Pleurodeles waltl TaxID=8319 RepID=A0AAV7QXM2_PLEWA|nr:hypothetical protein NDU88_010222 [Pleurodeles waltl]
MLNRIMRTSNLLHPSHPVHHLFSEMPSGKPSSKTTSKPAQQLLFTEALLQTHPIVASKRMSLSSQADDPVCLAAESTMDRILQEIMVVGYRLEGIDSNISAFMAETKSICADIAGFQNHVTDLEHHISAVEDRLNTLLHRDQELLFLRSKVVDLEDRRYWDNIHFPEHVEGSDVKGLLKKFLLELTG